MRSRFKQDSVYVNHWRLTKILAMVMCLYITAGCVSRNSMHHTVHSFNVSESEVYDFQIHYGSKSFPRSPLSVFHGPGGAFSFSMEMKVPEIAIVTWRTAEGESHREEVIIRENVTFDEYFAKYFRILFQFNEGELEVFFERTKANSIEAISRRIH